MFSKTIAIIIFITILFNNFIEIKSLVKLSTYKEYPYPETVARDAVNKLFSDFKLIKNKKIYDFSTINNYLTSVTLDRHDTLKDIVKLTRIDYNDNKTDFVDIINEILNGGDNDNHENKVIASEERVVEYIGDFINDLENWKVSLNLNDVGINKEILQHFNRNKSDNLINNQSDILSDGEFWQPSGRRIFRGDRTKVKYFPFMASIQIFQSFQCGGSIIKSDLVITAASCLQLAWNNRLFRENPAFLSVRVGSTFYHGGGESIPVIEVYFHPDYNPKNLYNNLCLLRLRRRIKFSKRNRKVKKIDIDRIPRSLPTNTDGVTIVGWGAKGTSNILEDPWKNRLSFAVLDFYPLQECRDVYSSEYVTNKHFCAGFFSRGGGACNRDVGGPGVVNGILAGVVSFGSPVCGTTDAPTVFVKLGYYSDWIDEIIAQEVPYAYKRTTLKPPLIIPYIAASSPSPKTTFVMSPIVGPMKPAPLDEMDTLRILKDESLFNEFLKTVFERKKSDTKIDNRGNIHDTAKNGIDENVPVTDNYEELQTKINFDDSTDTVTEVNGKFTIIDDNGNVEKELEKDIVKLMENIDVNEDDKSSESLGTEEQIDEDKNTWKTSKHEYLHKTDQEVKKMNDSILTLLYLSDSEKKDEALEDVEGVQDGLAIPEKPFKDLTFRNNRTDILDVISKDELYDLLAEALNETQINNEE